MDYLFRGFHECEDGKQIAVVDGKEHKGEWIDGYFFKIWHEYYILWGTTNGIPNMLEVLPETVGLWTGLTDKNGKMIFANDKIYSHRAKNKYTVIWEDCAFEISDEYGNRILQKQESVMRMDCEVIGTVFENNGGEQ